MSMGLMESILLKLLGPQSLNFTKDLEEGTFTFSKMIWGLVYHTKSLSRQLPAPKLEKAAYLLHLPDFDYGNTRVMLKLLQELRGNQEFWISTMPNLVPSGGATNALLGPPAPGGRAMPKGDPKVQARAFSAFLGIH